jgi:hypothetical protein
VLPVGRRVADGEAQGQLALEHEGVVQGIVGLEVRPDDRDDAATTGEVQRRVECTRAFWLPPDDVATQSNARERAEE